VSKCKKLLPGSVDDLRRAYTAVADGARARFGIIYTARRGGRAVDCSSLENWRPFTGTVGSNPTPSATHPTPALMFDAVSVDFILLLHGVNQLRERARSEDFSALQ
jgi:hypothetical protein